MTQSRDHARRSNNETSGYPPATRADWIRAILISLAGFLAVLGIIVGGLILLDTIYP